MNNSALDYYSCEAVVLPPGVTSVSWCSVSYLSTSIARIDVSALRLHLPRVRQKASDPKLNGISSIPTHHTMLSPSILRLKQCKSELDEYSITTHRMVHSLAWHFPADGISETGFELGFVSEGRDKAHSRRTNKPSSSPSRTQLSPVHPPSWLR